MGKFHGIFVLVTTLAATVDFQTYLLQQGIKEATTERHRKAEQYEVWIFHTNDSVPRHGKVRHEFATDNWLLYWEEDPWMTPQQ
jgi:hypothetical protein